MWMLLCFLISNSCLFATKVLPVRGLPTFPVELKVKGAVNQSRYNFSLRGRELFTAFNPKVEVVLYQSVCGCSCFRQKKEIIFQGLQKVTFKSGVGLRCKVFVDGRSVGDYSVMKLQRNVLKIKASAHKRSSCMEYINCSGFQ